MIFKLTVHYLLKWIKFSVLKKALKNTGKVREFCQVWKRGNHAILKWFQYCLFSEATELVFASVKPQATEQTMNLVASPLRRSHASPLSGIPYGDSLRLSDAAKR